MRSRVDTLVKSTSASHVELDVTDEISLLRLAQLLGVSAERVCKASVIFVREGLTDESCYDTFTQEARAQLAERDSTLELFQPP